MVNVDIMEKNKFRIIHFIYTDSNNNYVVYPDNDRNEEDIF
jgi:hypothetical protein